jgi:transposase
LLYKPGIKVSIIAEIFYIEQDTVRNWVKRWDWDKKAESKSKSGKPPILTPEEEKELLRIVDENNPINQGFNLASWDCPELAKLVKIMFNKIISAESVRRILLKNEYSYKKVNYLFTKRDETQREHYVREVVHLSETNFENTELFFMDEMSAKLHSKQNYVWSKEKKVVFRTDCSHKRITVSGAVNLKRGNNVITVADRNDCDSFLAFLDKLGHETESKNVILYVDNYPVHHSRRVREYLHEHPRIKIKYLPKYSPDLNPQEWFWGYLRKKGTNSLIMNSLSDLKTWILNFCKNLSPDLIKSVCSYSIFEKKYTF